MDRDGGAETPQKPRRAREAFGKLFGALLVALTASFGVYWLLMTVRPEGGVISFSFLLILPAAVSALVAYVADPFAERGWRFYLWIPVWIVGAVAVGSFWLLKEGLICIVLLSPLWVGAGMIGTVLTYTIRRRIGRSRTYSFAMLIAPVAALVMEPLVPLQARDFVVRREIVVAASQAEIWPLLEGVSDVRPDEGRWNVTQDVFGVPRPLGATLVGRGVGAERQARWANGIKFREQVTEWNPGRRIGWRFAFDDMDGWDHTDPHLKPNTRTFRVLDGGYTLTPLPGGRTRVSLDTRYRIRTPVNDYSAAWGEVFLGDLETNLLAMIKARAERSS